MDEGKRSQVPSEPPLTATSIVAGAMTLVALIAPWFHPRGYSFGQLLNTHVALILLETIALQCMLWLIAKVISLKSTANAMRFLVITHGAVLLVTWANAVLYRWSGQLLLSPKGMSIIHELPTQLMQFANTATIATHLFALVITVGYLVLLSAIGVRCSRMFKTLSSAIDTDRFEYVVAFACLACVVLSHGSIEEKSMLQPTRHPYAIFSVSSLTPARKAKREKEAPAYRATIDKTEKVSRQSQLKKALQTQRLSQRLIRVTPKSAISDNETGNFLIVILESFRAELVEPKTMPWLSKKTEEAIYCNNHFSGGNASQHGIFSIVNGLNAYWFYQPVTYNPLLNRLYKQAGYELGFFGSKNDWSRFKMDGFIDSSEFDFYRCTAYDGIKTDRATLASAMNFLEDRSGKTPRLAIAYLYSTHAPYESYPKDRVFSPSADARVAYPYNAGQRDQVWNRYRNSAHSLDRLLSQVDLTNTHVLITGDHGESFLEDQTIGHGTKISNYQNQCPAILFGPKVRKRHLSHPTMHADLLPTLLSIADIRVSHPNAFDGMALDRASETALSERIVCTRDYFSEELLLITCDSRDEQDRRQVLIEFNLKKGSFVVKPKNSLGSAVPYARKNSGRISLLDAWLHQTFSVRNFPSADDLR